MASGFSSGQSRCEGQHCTENGCGGEDSLAMYLVNEPQVLCDSCAAAKSLAHAVVPMRSRCVFYCAKHDGKSAENYCETHEILVCGPCALASHQSPCDLKVTEDALKEKVKTLGYLNEDAFSRLEFMYHQERDVDAKIASIHKRIQAIKDDIKEFYGEKTRRTETERKLRDQKIMQEAEEAAKRINNRREILLQESANKAHAEETQIKKDLETTMRHLHEATDSDIRKVTAELRGLIDSAIEATSQASSLLLDDDRVLENGKNIEKSLRGVIGTPASVDILPVEEALAKIQDIKFNPEGDCGRGIIEGIGDVWTLSSTIQITLSFGWPRIGFVTDNTVLVHDLKTKWLYSVDLDLQVATDLKMHVDDFSVWKSNSIATVSGCCLSIWSLKWTKLQDIAIPRDSQDKHGISKVTTNRQGDLLVSQRKIDVIDPVSKTRTRQISIKVKEIHDILVLENGNMVVKTSRNKFITLDTNGVKKDKIQRPYWDKAALSQNLATDALYVVYVNGVYQQISVDVISPVGRPKQEWVHVDKELLDPRNGTHCAVYDAQKMCICNGDKLHIFKK